MTNATDQLAPVVARPRTVQVMQPHEFSISYHMTYMQGTFHGTDTLTLTNRGKYNINNRLSDKRDALAISASPYLVHHIQQMVEEKRLPQWYGQDKIGYAALEYPDHVVEHIKSEHCKGATFITLEDAIETEIQLRQTSRQVITIEEGNTVRQIHFQPAWPSAILFVHPVDSWGAAFPPLPNMKDKNHDTRSMWVVAAILTRVPRLWKSIAENVSNTTNWYGWLLKYVSQHCFPNTSIGKQATKSNPFKASKSQQELQASFFEPINHGYFEPNVVEALFGNIPDVRVVSSTDFAQLNWANIVESVVVTYRNWDVNVPITLPHLVETARNDKLWELRLIIMTHVQDDMKWKGACYARHGTVNFPLWWFYERGNKESRHYSQDLKEKYLLNCGGQIRIRCAQHQLPLVTAPLRTNIACYMCEREIRYVCPFHECNIGICRNHFGEKTSIAGIQPVYISPQELPHAINAESQSSDDGTFVPQPSSQSSDDESDTTWNDWYNDFYSGDSSDELTADDAGNPGEWDGFDDDPAAFQPLDHLEDGYVVDAALVDLVLADVDNYLSNQATIAAGAAGQELNPNNCVTCNVFVGDQPGGDADDNDEFNEVLPTTNAGRTPIYSETSHHNIGLHVIFNKHGHLLVRGNYKLEPSRGQANFLQCLVATRANTTIPLVYPDAMMFPSIFWNTCPDGSVVGSIPSALLLDDAMLKRLGIASLQDHYQARLLDASLLTSTDYRYLYHALDGMLNLRNRGQDTRIIFSRGIGALENERGGARCIGGEPQEHLFDSDSIDSRPVVNKLAAAMGDEMPTFFYTHTCSMKTHFGIRVIRSWLDSEEAMDRICSTIDNSGHPFSTAEKDQVRHDLMHSSCLLALRCWINVVHIYMQYITKSKEKPIGTVTKSWYRLELQDAKANLPHIHAMIWLKENDGTEEGIRKVVSHIRASTRSMVTLQEEKEYIRRGVVTSQEELREMLKTIERILLHKHSRRCLIPSFQGNQKFNVNEVAAMGSMTFTELLQQGARCKVPNNFLMSPNPNEHCFVEVSIAHSDAALEVMQIIGLVGEYAGNGGFVEFLDPRLVVKRHIPPTTGGEGILSPALVPLLLYVLSSMNVQWMDMYTASRYCAKYAGGTDERNRLYLKPPNLKQEGHTVNVHAVDVGNTKITSVKHVEDGKAKLERRQPNGMVIGQTDAGMLALGIHQVYTDIKFIHITTVPLEERPGFDRPVPIGRLVAEGIVNAPVNSIDDIDAQTVLPSHLVRNPPYRVHPMKQWRQFLESAVMLAKDQLLSPYSIDVTTVFGLRPPELLFVNQQENYFKWFERFDIPLTKEQQKNRLDSLIEYCHGNVRNDYDCCAWIDATTKIVKVRAAALPSILKCIQEASFDEFGIGADEDDKNSVLSFFQFMHRYFVKEKNGRPPRRPNVKRKWAYMKDCYLCDIHQENLPVTWYTPIKPVQSNRFLIHVLLSMGKFSNELELTLTGSMRNAFIKARLYNPDPAHREQSINDLTRKYVMTQLLHQPGGTPQFDRFVVATYNVLKNALMNDSLAADGLPPCMYTHLIRDTNDKIETFMREVLDQVKVVVLKQLQDLQLPNLPSIEELKSARTNGISSPWDAAADVPRGVHQPLLSYQEQQHALAIGAGIISQYINVRNEFCPKCFAIVGDPGAGKTTVLNMLVMHAMSRGLNVMVTAVMAERALQLGGTHIHPLFSLPYKQTIRTPGHIADLAIRQVYQQPQKHQLLQRLDVIAIDELGQVSAEQLGVLDIILRRVRNSSRFMGGVLLICSLDILQLLAIRGRPALLSPHMLTTFKFARLNHSVRAASDPNWQRIQKITRIMPTELTPEIIQEFQDLVRKNCTFVTSFDDPFIKKSALLVFGRKDARNKAQSDMIAKMKRHGNYTMRRAVDEEATKEGNWMAASELSKKKLERTCKEPTELYFFQGGLYEMTYNKAGCFSQSQLAILMDVPAQRDLDAFRPIEICVSPAGNKMPPPDGVTKQELLRMNYTVQKVGATPDRPQMIAKDLSARRLQYAVRNRFSSTIHACMGQELSQLVTRVDMNTELYNIWDRAQVVVLLSRTKRAADTIFVGDSPESTIATLTATLQRTTQYTRYICYLLEALTRAENDDANPVTLVDQQNHPFQPIDIELPMDNSGCCYILVSCRDTSVTYIGETSNLPARIDAHNSGHGSHQTHSEYLRPWAVLAYVVGFEGSVAKRKAFESQWKNLRVSTTEARGRLCAVDVAELAKHVIAYRKTQDPNEDLRYVRTGTVSSLVNPAEAAPTSTNMSQTGDNVTTIASPVQPTLGTSSYMIPDRVTTPSSTNAAIGQMPVQRPTRQPLQIGQRRHNASNFPQSAPAAQLQNAVAAVTTNPTTSAIAQHEHADNSLHYAGVNSDIEDVTPTLNSAGHSRINLSHDQPIPLTSVSHPRHPLYMTQEEWETANELTLARERSAPLTVSEIEAAMTTSNFGTRLRYRLRNKLLLQPLTGNNISYVHYHTLSPGLYLCDPIMVYFLRNKTRVFVENSTIHLFDSAQYTLWQDHDRDRDNSFFLPPGSVLENFFTRRLRRGPNILNCHGWLFPVADGKHWQLIVVAKPKSRERKIAVIDSLVGGRHRPFNIASLEKFITQVVNTAVRMHTPAGSDPDYVSQDQFIRFVSSPIQPNGFDCGVFTICNAFHACHHLDDIANATSEDLDITHWYTASEGANQRAIMRNELRDHILQAAHLTAQNQRA
jgi:predicted GIY-YIG superfamily endonuclease